MRKWKGSKVHGADIKFSRRFLPHHSKIGMSATIAYFDYDTREITMFLPGFCAAYTNKNSYAIQRKVMNTINHELIHGVIMDIFESDRYNGQVDLHWPHLNGMDDDYRRETIRCEKETHKH